MTPGSSGQLSAVCPEHPESPSIATCARCGRFLCATCRVTADPPLCRSCQPLALDPLGIVSTPFSLGATLRNGWRMFVPVLPAVLVIAFVFSVPAGLISAAVENAGVSDGLAAQRAVNFYDAFIGLIGDIACLALFVGVAEGRSLSLGQALKEGTSSWGRVFGARFRAGLITLLFTLLLILPGIWKGVLLSFVVEAAFRVRSDDPLEYSTSLVQPRWWPVFGVLLLGGVIAYLPAFVVSAVVGGVTAVVPVPLVATEIATDWFARVGDTLASAFSLATFYGLNKTDGRTLPSMSWAS